MGNHLIFYDGECGFCDCAVRFFMKIDKKQIFSFAPLQGMTASKMLRDTYPKYKNLDTMILVENYLTDPAIYTEAKAGFRAFWLIGGVWAIPGVFFFLPSFMTNWGYRLVAKNRYLFGIKTSQCPVPPRGQENRFLP